MKRTYLSALAALSFASSAFACGPEDYTGSICTTANTYCPAGTFEADGTVLSIQRYPALYSLIGPYYGGDGKTTFALPDLRGRTPVGYGQGPGTSYVQFTKPRGQESVTLTAANLPAHTHLFTPTTGSQNVTIPATSGSGMNLTGTVSTTAAAGNTQVPSGTNAYRLAGFSLSPGAPHGPYTTDSLPTPAPTVTGVSVDASGMTPNIPAKTVTVQTVTGGAVGYNNNVSSSTVATIPPQLGMRYCIVYNGIYPDRP